MLDTSDKPTRSRWPWPAIFVAAIFGAYVGGYFLLGAARSDTGPDHIIRDFPYDWMISLYWPMGFAEAYLREAAVILTTEGGFI